MKKILVIHASAGHGHEKAARAIYEKLSEKKEAATVTLLDSLDLTRGSFGRSYRSTYLSIIRHAPWLWGLLYYLSDNPVLYFFIGPIRRLVNAYFAGPLEKKIRLEDPDVVICTHFMSAEVAGHLKKAGRLRAALVTVVTDYMAHSFWIHRGTDRYAVASEETLRFLRRRGVPAEKITVTGIPIEKKFSAPMDRGSLRDDFGVGRENFTVLVTSGGAGIGSMRPLIQKILELNKPIDVLAVCGTNEGLLKQMKSLAAENDRIHAFGFVDNIQELMVMSDVVIGKGGGLTVSECLGMGRPMILFGSLPGQETRNAECLVRHEAARIAPGVSDVLRFLIEFADVPGLLQEYTQAAQKIGRPAAADEIAWMVLGFPSHG